MAVPAHFFVPFFLVLRPVPAPGGLRWGGGCRLCPCAGGFTAQKEGGFASPPRRPVTTFHMFLINLKSQAFVTVQHRLRLLHPIASGMEGTGRILVLPNVGGTVQSQVTRAPGFPSSLFHGVEQNLPVLIQILAPHLLLFLGCFQIAQGRQRDWMDE